MACPVCCAGLFWHVLEQEIDWTVSAIYEERASSIYCQHVLPTRKKKVLSAEMRNCKSDEPVGFGV